MKFFPFCPDLLVTADNSKNVFSDIFFKSVTHDRTTDSPNYDSLWKQFPVISKYEGAGNGVFTASKCSELEKI
jgi:hypothetical protein